MIYHFIGIGGIGMSGLARILLEQGQQVTGSDISASKVTEELVKLGAKVFIGHDKGWIPKEGKIICTSDIKPNNEEYLEAKRMNLPVMHRSDLLQELMRDKKALLVAGSHGKTTTSSLLTHILVQTGNNPSFCIGGIVQSLKTQSGYGQSDWFVAEADESDGSFLRYTPLGAIITNIGADHLNYWKTEENLVRGFAEFGEKVSCKDLFFWCADDPHLASLGLQGISYGFSPKAGLRIENVEYLGWMTKFDFFWKNHTYHEVKIPLIGKHNVLNASAVIGLCLQIGLKPEEIFSALKSFSGAGRRCEKKGEVKGISIYDDYGHHPTEIKTTLQAIRTAGKGRRVVALFQPHRFSRTKDCFSCFGEALTPADVVLLTDVYSAGESPIEGIDAKSLVKEIESQGFLMCKYVPMEKIVEEAASCVQEGDIVISLGAGDITKVGPALLDRLSI